MSTNRADNYLPTLDGWRAIAILMVVLGHALAPKYCTGADAPFWCRSVLLGGYGVAIFFALSGFLITSRLLDEHERRDAISLKRFYLRRSFRILPAAFVYLAVIAVLGFAGALPVAPVEITSSVFFFRNYIPIFLPHDAGMYTSQFWSLAVEEHFYLLWPLLLIVGLRSRRALQLAVAVAVAVAVWRRLEGHFQLLGTAIGLPGYQFLFRTDTRLDALLWGCIFALALRDARLSGWIRRWLTPPVWLALLVVFAIGIAIQMRGILWVTLLSPMLIVGTLLHPQALAGRLLETPALRWIGRVSYSLYLWHPLVMPQFAGAVVMPRVQSWPVNVVIALVLTVFSYYLVEKPMIRLGHRLTHQPLPAVTPPEREHAGSG